MAVDSAGNVFLAGTTDSRNFPTGNSLQSALRGEINAFVTKFNSAGSALSYSTYLGGSNSDVAVGIAVDNVGGAYVTGVTDSRDFPTVGSLQPTYSGGVFGGDGFVLKIADPQQRSRRRP